MRRSLVTVLLVNAACLLAVALAGCSSDDAPPQPTSCSATSCTGCCLGTQCVSGNTTTSCGKGGLGCLACASGESCSAGACSKQPTGCSTTSCASGCCYNDVCMPGDNAALCGAGGKACAACKDGERCSSHACQVTACGPTSCASGCCDAKGNCQSGDSEASCGSGGQLCAQCPAGNSCSKHTCQGTPTCSCPGGCCDGAGKCQPGDLGTACGTGGGACVACGSTQTCAAGKCTCSPGACPGCCQGDQCKTGDATTACGKGGAACASCSTSQICSQGGCTSTVSCDPSTCKSGCCQNNICQTPSSSTCGVLGGTCQACGMTESCTSGICNNSLLCNSYFCSSGCCKDSSCNAGTVDQACGTSGQLCKACSPSETCVGGNCVAKLGVKWDITVGDAMLKSTTTWDNPPADPAPDVFVELTVGSQKKHTSTVDNSYNPQWNEYLLTDTSQNITNPIFVTVADADAWWSEPIAECTITVSLLDLAFGSKTITSCGSSPDLLQLVLRFAPSIYF